VWIFALRRQPVVQIKDRIDSFLKEDAAITTGIIKPEILAGAKTEKEYSRFLGKLCHENAVPTVSLSCSF
jgi:hypothetical protein